MSTRLICTGVLAAAALTLNLRVGAQDVLGGGRVLDNNLGVGMGRINQPSAAPNYRDRNLLITGDVIGGRQFRDSVGYTAEADFRGALGSNSLFRFRADSAISSPRLYQLGETYEQLRYGQSLGLIEYRRSGSADPATLIARDPIVINDPASLRTVDRQTMMNSLAFRESESVEPRIIGSAQSRDGTLLYFNASPVRGIVTEPASQASGLIGLSTYDTARIISDALENQSNIQVGNPYATQFDQLSLPGAEPKTPDAAIPSPTGELTGSQRLETSVASQHQNILERVVERYATATNVGATESGTASTQVLRDLDTSYKQLREQLTSRAPRDSSGELIQPTKPGWQTLPAQTDQAPSQEPSQAGPSTLPGATPSRTTSPSLPGTEGPRSTDQARPGLPQTPVRDLEHLTPTPPPRADGTAPPAASPAQPGAATPPVDTGAAVRAERQRLLARPELTGALKHGLRVDQLSTTTQNRFNELVISAEKSLSEGDYFVAERRFDRALRLVPGHPMASVGMAHAQLGAGLYLSASLTLRTLFAEQPEMIDVTYAPHILPAQERMTAAIDALRARMTEETPARDRASYNFLLAYIGHQTRQADLVREGLAGMATHDAENPLVPLLEKIWLDAQQNPTAPSAAPAPAPQPEK